MYELADMVVGAPAEEQLAAPQPTGANIKPTALFLRSRPSERGSAPRSTVA